MVGTGKNTEFGMIWTMMKDVDVKKTPLQLKMEQLGKHLSIMSVSLFQFFLLHYEIIHSFL